MRKVTFDIDGMTCSSCSAHVERAVNGLSGIKTLLLERDFVLLTAVEFSLCP